MVTPYSSALKLTFPSSLLSSNYYTLSVTEFLHNPYSPLKADNQWSASSALSVNLYANNMLSQVTSSIDPILLTLPLDSTNPYVANLIEAVFSSSPTTTKEKVIQNN